MPDAKLTALTAAAAVTAADLLYVVTDVAGTPTSKKATLTTLFTAAGSTLYPDITNVASTTITLGAVTNDDLKVSINGPYSALTVGGVAYANMLLVHDNSTDIESLLTLHRMAPNATALAGAISIFAREGDGTGGVIANGNWLGGMVFAGHDGTDFETAAAIIGVVDGAPGNNDMPGRLEFYTTPDGAAALALHMVIASTGITSIGPNGATNPTLQVVTNTASGATGLSITNAAEGSGVTLTALSSGASDNLNLNAKGATGRLNLAATGGIWAANFIDVGTSGVRFSLGGNGLRSTVGGPFIIWGNSPQRTEIQNDTVSMLTVAYPGLVGIGAGTGTPTYGLHLSPTAGLTAGQTVLIVDNVASTGSTRMILAKGAVAGNIFEVRSNNLATLYTSITDAGVLDTVSYKVGGAAGVSFNGSGAAFAALTTVTFVNGILTVAS